MGHQQHLALPVGLRTDGERTLRDEEWSLGAVLAARKAARQRDPCCASKAESTPYSSELDTPRSRFRALPAHLLPPLTPVDRVEGEDMESPEGT